MVGGYVSGIIVPHRMTAQDGGTLPPALKPDVAPVLVNMIPMPPLVQSIADATSHIGGRLAVGMNNRVMQILTYLLKTNDIYLKVSDCLGDDMHFRLVLMHRVERAVAGMLFVGMQVKGQ